jgi:hypothetical protein
MTYSGQARPDDRNVTSTSLRGIARLDSPANRLEPYLHFAGNLRSMSDRFTLLNIPSSLSNLDLFKYRLARIDRDDW